MEDVAGLIDASGARRVVLLGHDWGGIVAWCFARRLRALERLVILNVPHPACFARSLRRPGQMLRSWYAGFFQVPWLPERLLALGRARLISWAMLRTSTSPATFPRDLLKATRTNAAQPGALKAMINWSRAFIRGGGLRRQLQQGFPPIDIPTLLIWGEEDRFLARYTTQGTDEFATDCGYSSCLAFRIGCSRTPPVRATTLCGSSSRDRSVGDRLHKDDTGGPGASYPQGVRMG